jgi:hypothetical protein
MERLCTPEQLKNYYPTMCSSCGWKGCSCELEGGHQIADTGDYGDCYCPKCGEVHDGDDIENEIRSQNVN